VPTDTYIYVHTYVPRYFNLFFEMFFFREKVVTSFYTNSRNFHRTYECNQVQILFTTLYRNVVNVCVSTKKNIFSNGKTDHVEHKLFRGKQIIMPMEHIYSRFFVARKKSFQIIRWCCFILPKRGQLTRRLMGCIIEWIVVGGSTKAAAKGFSLHFASNGRRADHSSSVFAEIMYGKRPLCVKVARFLRCIFRKFRGIYPL
jgi:hypothetical protein